MSKTVRQVVHKATKLNHYTCCPWFLESKSGYRVTRFGPQTGLLGWRAWRAMSIRFAGWIFCL